MFTIARLFTFVLVLFFTVAASAADISCRDPEVLGSIIPESPGSRDYPGWSPFRWSGRGDGGCFIADLNGKITPGDADKLEWLLNG